MDFFNILELLGGLGLFLYGMTVMGQGLEKLSGGKLEKILGKLTSSPIKGVLLGTAVTAVIQSSSATTVMLVGFVNSGIMRLSQSIGVIMGANIGTTMTAWILSLTGIEGDNFFIKILKPANFSLLFAIMGAVFYIFMKSGKKQDIGQILLGFTVLIYGMHMMSGAVEPLKDSESFASALLLFKNPVLGVLLGAAVTGIIQSSSASVGILQALSLSTPIPFSVAFPIILGQKIGTCVTALLSCIGTNKNAKRTAVVHLYFNVISALLFLPLMYVLNGIFSFSFWDETVSPVTIAVFHSAVSIMCTFLFLPLTKFFEKLAYMTIKDDEKALSSSESVHALAQMLDDRFLKSPSFALEQCKTTILKMGNIAKTNVFHALNLISHFSSKGIESISENEDKIDILEDKLSNYLIKLTDKDLSFQESKSVSKYLHSISDFERIGDHAENIMDISIYISDNDVKLSKEAKAELDIMSAAIKDILNLTIEVFTNDDPESATSIEPLEEVIDMMRDTLKTRHVERLKRNECTIDAGVAFNDLLSNLERISDHCSNIALYVINLTDDKRDEKFESHQYLRKVRTHENEAFSKKYNEYTAKYFERL